MRIFLNGEETQIQGTGNVADLVDRYHIPRQSILIEHNGMALHPREWQQRNLSEGDRIEVVRVVAGG